MKKIVYIFIIINSLLTFSQNKITKQLDDFTTLKVYYGIELELIKSTDQKLEITGNKSEMVKIKNVNNTLKISLPFSLKPKKNAAKGEALVKLYYNKTIKVIDANEGSTITGKELYQDKVVIKSQEKAYINLVIKSNLLEVKAISGGIIKLSGSTTNQIVDVDLYGIYHGFNLKAKSNTIVNAGTGAKAEVTSLKTLNAKVSFGGSIFYKGNPEVLKDKKVVGGIIQKRD